MEPSRFKMIIALSSDHAGIASELKKLEREMYRVIARIDDARAVRNYLETMREHSEDWLTAHPHYAPWDREK